jgi:hypothetical protein
MSFGYKDFFFFRCRGRQKKKKKKERRADQFRGWNMGPNLGLDVHRPSHIYFCLWWAWKLKIIDLLVHEFTRLILSLSSFCGFTFLSFIISFFIFFKFFVNDIFINFAVQILNHFLIEFKINYYILLINL